MTRRCGRPGEREGRWKASDSEEWGAETLDEIADAAYALGLAEECDPFTVREGVLES
jgi:hypothetical protein